MKNALAELSASDLRRLLIEEIERFIEGLNNCTIAELMEMKILLRKIFDLLYEKEREEFLFTVGKNFHINWDGKYPI